VASRVLLSLSASAGHTCVADDQQRLWCWGDNTVGQLAADLPSVSKPLVVATGGWIDVAAGGLALGHTCAIHSRGSLWCWGDNSRGQLGLGPAETRPSVSRVTQVNKDAWLQVSTGALMTCAIREDGTLWCWGAGDDGRLGVEGDSSVPRIVGTDRDWRSVSAGAAHACAIKQDNSLWCWGSNENGRLGRSDVAVAATSARPGVVGTSYASVSAGNQHTCGIRLDKTLWCWGRGAEGQSGQPVNENLAAPKQVAGGFVDVSAGGSHTCAVRQGGVLLCWGKNDQGQLGLGFMSASVLVPTVVASDKLWLTTVAGGEHTCAMADDGTLWCWGAGNRAQTGLGPAAIALPNLLPLL